MSSSRSLTVAAAALVRFTSVFLLLDVQIKSVAVFQSAGGLVGRSSPGLSSGVLLGDLVSPTGGGGGGVGGPGAAAAPSIVNEVSSSSTSLTTSLPCPRTCFCNTLSRIVYCSRRGLQSIPGGVPSNTLQLNLNSNEFQTPNVDRRNFSKLIDMEHLYMSECGIERIAVDTFADLTSLRWLDLSNNRIKVIEDDTFRGISLQHLFLNGNRQIQLLSGSFQGLSTNGLYLHDCSLMSLPPEILAPLNSTIRYLWLNGNELDIVDRRLAPLFNGLQHLRLGANPLRCDCSTIWLKQFYDSSPDVFRGSPAPSCRSPARLRTRSFNESTVDDFRCVAPQFTRAEAVFNGSVGRLVCAAAGDPAPTVYWIQPSGRATRHEARSPQQQQQQQQPAVQPLAGLAEPDAVNEDIVGQPDVVDGGENEGVLNVDVAEPGIRMHGMYICIAANSAGNVTLTINLPPAGTPLSRLPVPPVALADERQETSTATSSLLTPLPPTGVRADRRTALEASTTIGPDADRVSRAAKPSTPSQTERSVSAVGVSGADLRTGSRLFTLTELVGAIVGTHVATLLVCLLAAWLCYAMRCSSRVVQRRARRIYERRGGGRSATNASGAVYTGCDIGCAGSGETLCVGGSSRPTSGSCGKLSPLVHSPCSSPPPEAVYLNGLGHLPYMEYVDLRGGRIQRR